MTGGGGQNVLPGTLPWTLGYFGLTGGEESSNLYFASTGAPVIVKLPVALTDQSNFDTLGWYSVNPASPDTAPSASTMHSLVGPFVGGPVSATFQPSAYYGLYIATRTGTFYTQPQFNSSDSLQHFAVFQQAASFYYVGVEDTVESESDLDYNDMVVTLGVATSAAHYSGLNTTAQGTWTGAYGADGSMIATLASSLPAYATVSVTGDTLYTWSASTSDVRALQTASGSSARIASTYYSPTTFTIDVNLTDGNTHQVALYLVDWDSTVRTESISIVDADTGAILDTETYSSFHNGEYAVWNVAGHVQIQVTRTGGANAVVSGLFFDPVVPSAVYSGLDTATQGTWPGTYGAGGELIANDVTNPPSYATVSFTGDTLYTWAASSTDVRALQVSSGSSSRIASAYYSPGSFTINVNLTDGNTHRLALYLVDWDSTVRTETISILNAVSGAVLDTETYSSFHNGEYAVWNVTGNVRIQVTRTGGSNGVVSGIFFD